MDFKDNVPVRLTINADNTISICEELGEYELLKSKKVESAGIQHVEIAIDARLVRGFRPTG